MNELPSVTEVTPLRLTADVPSPLRQSRIQLLAETDGVLVAKSVSELQPTLDAGLEPAAFAPAGPRADLAFRPERLCVGIVTCGGLCPGLNDVIRSIVLTLQHHYRVPEILGFRYGFAGVAGKGPEPMRMTPDVVDSIHRQGGSLLGSSRGPQPVDQMLDHLARLGVRVLFCIGGDGTLQGASVLSHAARERGQHIGIVGIPKTIDNDLSWVDQSFGFSSAIDEAIRAIEAAHNEARGAINGVGIVKLMGRHSGFIAAQASLSNPDVNLCIVPEIPFALEGPGGLLQVLEERLASRSHAVIVVGEGAGQEMVGHDGTTDASGNARLGDVGAFLRDRIRAHFEGMGRDITVKYIDPSYTIRSLPANAFDAQYCNALGQHATHAGLAGFTDAMVGRWNGRFTVVPLHLVTRHRRQLDPGGDVWQRVLQSTGQPDLVGPS
ncbi:MAG: ATP-dependent 6-phosphofructokinase [Actinomycetia bacterium]|nr:ATP-dependent 6-phosphofructokinase [Actinomycetes bacterium]